MVKKAQVAPKPMADEGWVYGTVDYISGEQGWKRNFSTVDKDIIAFVYDDGGTFSWAVDVNGAQVAYDWDRDSAEDAMAEAEDWVASELVVSVPFASRRIRRNARGRRAFRVGDQFWDDDARMMHEIIDIDQEFNDYDGEIVNVYKMVDENGDIWLATDTDFDAFEKWGMSSSDKRAASRKMSGVEGIDWWRGCDGIPIYVGDTVIDDDDYWPSARNMEWVFQGVADDGRVLLEFEGDVYDDEYSVSDIQKCIRCASRKHADVGALEHAKGTYDTVQFWYTEAYPTDDMGAEINPYITFENCARRIAEGIGDGFYDYINAHDSLIRERIFDELSYLYGIDYDSIYHAWLYCDERHLMSDKEFVEVLPDAAAFCRIVEGGRRAFRKTASDSFAIPGTDYALAIDGFYILIMKDGSQIGSVRYEDGMSEYRLCGDVLDQIGKPRDDEEREELQEAIFDAVYDVIDWYRDGMFFDYASRKTAGGFYLDLTERIVNGDSRWEGSLCNGEYYVEVLELEPGLWEACAVDDSSTEVAFGYGDTTEEAAQELVREMSNMGIDVTASRKTAKNFPTLDEFKRQDNVFGDERWVYEDDSNYIVMGPGLHGRVDEGLWEWEIADAYRHSDIQEISLHGSHSMGECYQDLRDEAFSGRLTGLWYDDMKDVVFGSRKKASEDEVEVNFEGEYCDGYVYISYDNDGDLLCDIDVECWGDNGEDVLDTTVSIPASYSAQNIAIELVGAAESEYGDDLVVDEAYLVEQIAYYFGKSASRKRAAVALDDMERRGNNSYVQKLIDGSGNELELQVTLWSNGWDWLLKDSDDILIADSDYTTFGSPYAAVEDFNDWCDFNVNGRKAALRKKSYSDTFEYGFYDKDDEFRGGEVHIEDDGEFGVWLVEIYGINGDSFEGYGSGDTPSEAARDACEDLDIELPEKEISDFLDHLEFCMTDPMEGGWTGVF